MRKGFVFGKFMPFHKGHEAMINFALTQCDFLTVLVCCSNKETMPAAWRVAWVKETFKNNARIEILAYNYNEEELPSTSVTSAEVSAIWAKQFKLLFPDYSLVVTAEPYGELVAGFMGIEHIPFSKEQHPVSATAVRNNLLNTWQYLPGSVKASLVTKVVLLGTESTGKTVLTGLLSGHFNCSAVSEAGRELIPDSRSYGVADLYAVANAHACNIDKAATGDSPLLIIDTDIHITLSYGEFAFGEKLNIDNAVYNSNKADLYLYLNNDVPFVQDGTRLTEAARNKLDLSHRRVLAEHNITCEEICGDWDIRFRKAVTLIEQLISNKRETWYI